MKPSRKFVLITSVITVFSLVCAVEAVQTPQGTQKHIHSSPLISVPLQPLAQQVRRIEAALNYLGRPLLPAEHKRINEAIANPDEKVAVEQLEEILDKYALAIVEINPESRVKVKQGPAKPELVEGGTQLFLVKVINEAGVTAPLAVESPNTGRVYIKSRGNPEPPSKLTFVDVRERWARASRGNLVRSPKMD